MWLIDSNHIYHTFSGGTETETACEGLLCVEALTERGREGLLCVLKRHLFQIQALQATARTMYQHVLGQQMVSLDDSSEEEDLTSNPSTDDDDDDED